MKHQRDDDVAIHYRGDEVILEGAAERVHAEARRILRRFAGTGRPFRVRRDTPTRIVLTARR